MLDLSKFKKVASDKHTTTMRHDDGHELKVVHSVLSPKLRKGIEKLPMAEGGQVSSATTSQQSQPTQQPKQSQPAQQPQQDQSEAKKVQDSFNRSLGFANGGPVGQQVQDSLNTPGEFMAPEGSQPWSPNITLSSEGPDTTVVHLPAQIPAHADYGEGLRALEEPVKAAAQRQDNVAAAAPAQEDHSGLSVLSGPSQSQMNPMIGRIADLTKPNPQLAAGLQQAYGQNIDQNQAIANNFLANKAQLDQEHQALVHDIANGHIDMSNYWRSNDRGAAALGALLGGMGSGLTHLANPVPGIIASSQENFLRAELANLDNPKSLLSAVQAQYGNNQNAADIMRVISNEALNNHLQQVMAPLNSATAQANAAQVQMSLLQNSEALKQQIAMRQALASNQQSDPSTRLLMLRQTGVINDEQYKEANKELGVAQKTAEAHQAADNLINGSMQLQTPGSRLGSPIQSKQKLDALNAELTTRLLEASPSKRFTPDLVKEIVKPYEVGLTTSKDTAEQMRKGLHSTIDSSSDQTPTLDGLRAYGIQKPAYQSAPSISPQQQQALQWLKANSSDPRAGAVAATLKSQGVPLQ